MTKEWLGAAFIKLASHLQRKQTNQKTLYGLQWPRSHCVQSDKEGDWQGRNDGFQGWKQRTTEGPPKRSSLLCVFHILLCSSNCMVMAAMGKVLHISLIGRDGFFSSSSFPSNLTWPPLVPMIQFSLGSWSTHQAPHPIITLFSFSN